MKEAINVVGRTFLGLLVVSLPVQTAVISTTDPGSSPASPTSQPTTANSRPQPVRGGYSSWSLWSPCTKSCGVGTRFRSRSCSNPVPMFGGRNCMGQSSQSESCGRSPCPVNGGYSQWTPWSRCSVTCGGGQKTKKRHCTNPAPQNGGENCDALGPKIKTKACSRRACPVHGAHSDWSEWSKCDAECGEGRQYRTRMCKSSLPDNGDKNCSQLGKSVDWRLCLNSKCTEAKDSKNVNQSIRVMQYSSWSECSASCGGGIKQRSRLCETENCSSSLANNIERRMCNTQPCVEFLEQPLNIGLICGGLVLTTILLLIVLLLFWRRWRSAKKSDDQPTDVQHIGDPMTDCISSSPTLPINQMTLEELRQSRTDMIDNPLRAELDWERDHFDKSPRYTAAPCFPGKVPYNGIQTTGMELATPEDFVFYRRPRENMQDLEKEAGKIFDVKMIRPGYDEQSLPRTPKDFPRDEENDVTKPDNDDKVSSTPRKLQDETQTEGDSKTEDVEASIDGESDEAPPIPARKCIQSRASDTRRLEEPINVDDDDDDDEEKPPLIPRRSTMKAQAGYKFFDKGHDDIPARPPTPNPHSLPKEGALDMFDRIIRELETVHEVDTDTEYEGERSLPESEVPEEGPNRGMAALYQRQGSEVYFEVPPVINRETKKRNFKRLFSRENSVEI